jgi:hypothetical protein
MGQTHGVQLVLSGLGGGARFVRDGVFSRRHGCDGAGSPRWEGWWERSGEG